MTLCEYRAKMKDRIFTPEEVERAIAYIGRTEPDDADWYRQIYRDIKMFFVLMDEGHVGTETANRMGHHLVSYAMTKWAKEQQSIKNDESRKERIKQ